MKLLPVLALASVAAADNRCGVNKHGAQLNEIGRFCQKQNLVVPSAYASFGVGHISIDGSCNPPQWIPMEYCMSQFQEMCANSEQTRKYGKNGCQTWKISYGNTGAIGKMFPPAKPKKPAPKPADPDGPDVSQVPL